MTNRGSVSLGTFAVAIMLVALAVPVSGQTPSDTWAPPRTPDGQPDLQGIWTNETITAFERPATLADKAVLTEEEARALEVQNAEQRAAGDGTGSYNEFWKDPGTEVVDTRRTSLVVDPPDGRVALRPDAEATRDHNLAHDTDSCGAKAPCGFDSRPRYHRFNCLQIHWFSDSVYMKALG